jgi:hypothetical protein
VRSQSYSTSSLRNERGIALVAVLLIALSLAALSLGAGMIAMNAGLIRRYGERLSVADDAALAGLEEGRSRLNGTSSLYPDSGYVVLEGGLPVRDASGTIIPGLSRSTWAGPSGVSSGQYGVFGSIISLVTDNTNIRAVRRLEVTQESFAKYAYFTDFEPSTIAFGSGDQIFGPVHSNDDIRIYSSGARFRDLVRTAGIIIGVQYGTFDVGYQTNVTPIPMPAPADLTKLQAQAQAGGMYFTGHTTGGTGEARTRVEFVAVDLNGDGDATDDDEGFIKVYEGAFGNEDFVSASRPGTITSTWNCGDLQGNHTGMFKATAAHTAGPHAPVSSLTDNTGRCLLGGDSLLTNGFVASDANGQWLPWGGPVDPRLTAAVGAAAPYHHPITRPLNPNFKGVIYVDGKVGVSGTVRGRVTLVSPSDIIILDNVKQATDPAAGVCDDILGLLAVDDVIVADNLINAPVNTAGSSYKTLRAVGNQDEVIHAVVLALDIFTVQNYDQGPTTPEKCNTQNWGRGCLRLTGGIIQRTRGAVGTTAGTGNLKRYSYNACAYTDPPPYFPTTGHFARNRFYEMNPVGFDVASWFATYQQ